MSALEIGITHLFCSVFGLTLNCRETSLNMMQRYQPIWNTEWEHMQNFYEGTRQPARAHGTSAHLFSKCLWNSFLSWARPYPHAGNISEQDRQKILHSHSSRSSMGERKQTQYRNAVNQYIVQNTIRVKDERFQGPVGAAAVREAQWKSE